MRISSCQNLKKNKKKKNCNILALHRQYFYGMIKSESELRHFMNKINQKHHSIKFDFKFSKESIEFLDTLVYIGSKNRLQVTLYKKPFDCQIYLLAKLAHLFSLKKVFGIVRHSQLSTYIQPSSNTGNFPKSQ